MRIMVTGANGYIGRNVVKNLLNKGHKVTAILFDGEMPHLFLNGAKLFYGNIFSLSQNEKSKLVQDSECLLHLAWQAGFNHRDPSHLANVMKHYEFLTSMAELGVKNISVAGTMHEVGYFVGPIDENTPCNPRSPYGIAKTSCAKRCLILQV